MTHQQWPCRFMNSPPNVSRLGRQTFILFGIWDFPNLGCFQLFFLQAHFLHCTASSLSPTPVTQMLDLSCDPTDPLNLSTCSNWTLSAIYLQGPLHSAILSLSSEFLLKRVVHVFFSCKISRWFFLISFIFETFYFSTCFVSVHPYLWSTFCLAALKPLLGNFSNCVISVLAKLRYFWFFIRQVS